MKTCGAMRWVAGALAAAGVVSGGQAFAAITSMNTTNNSSNITYAFQYASPGSHYHAYIDCDDSFTTGYQSSYGVGADYLIEDGNFHKWVGPGFTWSPPQGSVTYSPSANTVVWTFPRSNIQASPCGAGAASAKVVFEVTHTGSPNEVSMLLTHGYLASSSGLTNDRTTNDGTNVTYRVQFSGTWAHYHVFIDSNQDPGSGYPVGGIGADYFVEDGNLRRYTGPGWAWGTPTPITFSTANGIATWTVPRSAMAETQTDERADIVYHVQDPTNTVTVTLPKRTHYYFGGTGLPKPMPAQTLVPLYVRPDQGTAWSELVAAHKKNLGTTITVIVNPASGPDASRSQIYADGITNLRINNIHVAGYVNSARATLPATTVDGDVDRWKQFYPDVDGIFYDLMAVAAGNETYYQQRTAHAKQQGFTYTIGNAGGDLAPTYVATVDTIVVYERAGTTTPMSSWWASYPRNGFAVIPYNLPTMDTAFISSAKQRVGAIYMTDESPDSWHRLSPYFSDLLGQLALAPPP